MLYSFRAAVATAGRSARVAAFIIVISVLLCSNGIEQVRWHKPEQFSQANQFILFFIIPFFLLLLLCF